MSNITIIEAAAIVSKSIQRQTTCLIKATRGFEEEHPEKERLINLISNRCRFINDNIVLNATLHRVLEVAALPTDSDIDNMLTRAQQCLTMTLVDRGFRDPHNELCELLIDALSSVVYSQTYNDNQGEQVVFEYDYLAQVLTKNAYACVLVLLYLADEDELFETFDVFGG